MDEFQGTVVLVALFLLRCIAPLVITLIIGYLMNRLVDHWQEQDLAGIEAENVQESLVAPNPSLQLPSITVPCWILRNCDPSDRKDCPASKQNGLPCWLVRMRHDGALPETCPECPIYTGATTAIA